MQALGLGAQAYTGGGSGFRGTDFFWILRFRFYFIVQAFTVAGKKHKSQVGVAV